MLRLVLILAVLGEIKCDLKSSNHKISMEVGEVVTLKANTVRDEKDVNVTLEPLNRNIVKIIPNSIQVDGCNKSKKINNCSYELKGLKAGQSEIYLTHKNRTKSTDNDFLVVKVYESLAIEWISSIIGWLYFSAWSISFYPQIYDNYKRKSVVGLNFDYLFFNILGYLMYNSFNIGLYFIEDIQEQYYLKHPGSLNPVHPNDLFFSVHGILATLTTIFQCFIYERADQRISIKAKIIVTVYFLVAMVYVIFASLATVSWLDVLYVCSYIKLCITVTKYMPQVYMNYTRKSTEGWSIGGILLDFIGGILSILQIVLDGYNYDDWAIIIENPTKFGLGILTIAFDLAFAFQHYVLYATTTNIRKRDVKLDLK